MDGRQFMDVQAAPGTIRGVIRLSAGFQESGGFRDFEANVKMFRRWRQISRGSRLLSPVSAAIRARDEIKRSRVGTANAAPLQFLTPLPSTHPADSGARPSAS